MSFGSRLRDKRNELNITQPQLAKLLGVSQSAVGSWETDVNSPRATLLYDLFEILHCDANYLFQDETRELYKNEATPEEFENIIKKYRSLDPHGKETVDIVLDRESARVKELQTHKDRIAELEAANEQVVSIVREPNADYLAPNAAHEKEGTSAADRERDDRELMNNDEL